MPPKDIAIFDEKTGIGYMQVQPGTFKVATSKGEFENWMRQYGVSWNTVMKTTYPPANVLGGGGRVAGAAQGFSLPSTGNPEIDEMQNRIVESYNKLLERGLQVNPYVEITPERAAEFLSQAEKEVEPYYSSQFRLAKESLLSSLGYTSDEIVRKEQEYEQDYRRSLRTLSESMAERGFAYSGVRGREEEELATETQRSMEEARRTFGYQAGRAAREFAQQWGGQKYEVPTMAEAPRVLPGQAAFQRTGRQLPLYELPTDVYKGLVGEREREREVATKGLAEAYKTAFREEEYAKRQRKLTL